MKYILFLFSFIPTFLNAQEVKMTGVIQSKEGENVSFANIYESRSKSGSTANFNGEFELNLPKGKVDLRISAVGYFQDNITFNLNVDTTIIFKMHTQKELLEEVVVSGTLTEMLKKESPIPVEVYSANYLAKVPSPGIFEATQNINGVRPQINCAVCNTGDIHINGMEGPYTMVTIDGMPIVGGLSTVYGLQGIPPSLLDRVEVVKGPASTLYGSEAVAGLVNVITKDVESASSAAFESSITSWQEAQVDVHAKYRIKNVKAIVGINYYNYSKPIDKNGDNFTDLTLKDRISIFNKWKFTRKKNRLATLLFRYLSEDRWGGEMQYRESFRGGDSIYGESINTNRFEVIGNYQLPTKPSIMFNASYSFHDQDSYYGTLPYFAQQHIGYGQLVWNEKINTKHKMIAGLTLRINYFDDNTVATQMGDSLEIMNNPDNWFLPGVFVQDNIKCNEKNTILVGGRYDYHQKHGNILTPRLNWKIDPDKNQEIRLGYGSGFRVVNIFTEDHAALTGARKVVLPEDLKPERSHNVNMNYVVRMNTRFSFITLDGSIFYTYFSNKIIPDYNTDDDKIIYSNLDGYAVSRGVSLNFRFLFEIPLRINVGATLLDVFSVNTQQGIEEKQIQLFAEKYTGTWSASYQFSRAKLSIDYTGSLYGPMKLPLVENDFRAEYSSPFSLQNIKISKEVGKRLSVNMGVRNLVNFTPPSNSILRANDPFDKSANDPVTNPNGYTFDPTYVYSSFQGRTYFVGLKYEFTKK